MIKFNLQCDYELLRPFLLCSMEDFTYCNIALRTIDNPKANEINNLYNNIIENARMNFNLLVEPNFNFEQIDSIPAGFYRNLRNSIESFLDLYNIIFEVDYFELLQFVNGIWLDPERYKHIRYIKYSDLKCTQKRGEKTEEKKDFNVYYKAEIAKNAGLDKSFIDELLRQYQEANSYVHPKLFQKKCSYEEKNQIIKSIMIMSYHLLAFTSWSVKSFIRNNGITSFRRTNVFNILEEVSINPNDLCIVYSWFEQKMNSSPSILIQTPDKPLFSPLIYPIRSNKLINI